MLTYESVISISESRLHFKCVNLVLVKGGRFMAPEINFSSHRSTATYTASTQAHPCPTYMLWPSPAETIHSQLLCWDCQQWWRLLCGHLPTLCWANANQMVTNGNYWHVKTEKNANGIPMPRAIQWIHFMSVQNLSNTEEFCGVL